MKADRRLFESSSAGAAIPAKDWAAPRADIQNTKKIREMKEQYLAMEYFLQ
jgi:hypothetical protein